MDAHSSASCAACEERKRRIENGARKGSGRGSGRSLEGANLILIRMSVAVEITEGTCTRRCRMQPSANAMDWVWRDIPLEAAADINLWPGDTMLLAPFSAFETFA